jgi:hypothetical protein
MAEDRIVISDISGDAIVRTPKKRSMKIGVGYKGGNLPEAYQTKIDYYDESEADMWDAYERLSFHMDFGAVFREALVASLLPPFHFESESGKHEDVERFWRTHDMDRQLKLVVEQAVTYGTGVGQYTFVGSDKGQLLHFKRLDTKSLKLDKDKKGIITVTQAAESGTKTIGKVPMFRPPDMMFFWQPFENPRSAYGWSAFRPVIHNLTGLTDLGKDIFAAIKNLAYTQRVMEMDLSDANTVEEKDSAIEDATEFFDRFESASNSVLVYENCHNYGFAGTAGSQTSSGTRMQSLMPIIEPVLSVALMRFKIALGHFQQADASRQVIKEQEEAMERAVAPTREDLKRKILNELVPRILKLPYPESEDEVELIPDHDVKLVWDVGLPSNIRDKIDIFSLAIEYQMVTPKYASEQCGFDDPYAEWDANGFLKASEMEIKAQEEQIAAAKARPAMGAGSSVASKQDARRNVRNKEGAN